MKLRIPFTIWALLLLIISSSSSCGEGEKDPVQVNAIRECNLAMITNEVVAGEPLAFKFTYTETEKQITDTIIFLDDIILPSGPIFTGDLPVGKHELRARFLFTDSSTCESYRTFELVSDIEPEVWSYILLRTLPHDRAAFTQGLTWYDGRLYEGTGVYGESVIYNYMPGSNDFKQKVELPMTFFGEGITILNDKLFQLTYKEGKAFVYDLESMGSLTEFSYPGEGWGLTDDGTHLIMSDGTHILRFLDPDTFEVIREQAVYSNKGKELAINEMEYVDGVIYANIYGTPYIATIDPLSGKVLSYVDCRGILPADQRTGDEDVFNGIAYDPSRQVFYLTGKYWPKLFEVRFNTIGNP